MRRISLAFFAFCLCTSPLLAQSTEEPLLASLQRAFKQEALSIGVVIQTVGDYQFDPDYSPGNPGFSLAAARLQVKGDLDGGFGYFFQTEFVSANPLLDARVSYTYNPMFTIDAGLFKAPFSAEFLIPAPGIDFVNRSRVVAALAPNRQVGVALRGTLAEQVTYSLGMFNGNGRSLGGNNDDTFLYVGRLATQVLEGLEVGANVGYHDTIDRFLLGGDFRFSTEVLLLSGEVIYANTDPVIAPRYRSAGFHGTVGYMLVPNRHQLLARIDFFHPDLDINTDDFLVFGYNFWPTTAFEFQVNYLFPIDRFELDKSQILLNFQVAF